MIGEQRKNFLAQEKPLYTDDDTLDILSKIGLWEDKDNIYRRARKIMAEEERERESKPWVTLLALNGDPRSGEKPQHAVVRYTKEEEEFFANPENEKKYALEQWVKARDDRDESSQQPLKMPQEKPQSGVVASDESSDKSNPKTVTSIGEGLNVAFDRAKLAWQYLGAQAKQHFTGEGGKEIEEISRQYGELPATEGAATIADIGANVIGAALPATLALALVPEAAVAVGVGGMVADVATTIADANMAVDKHERETGVKVPDKQRGMYVTAVTATNTIMDALVNSSVFKQAIPGGSKVVAEEIFEKMIKNPVAQAEFTTMTQQVLRNEARAYGKEVGKAAVSGGVTSGALEAEKGIYTNKAPELEKIITSTLEGAAMGTVAGGLQTGAVAFDRHRRRMDEDNIAYASNIKGGAEERFPISEIRNVKVDPETGMAKVDVIPSQGGFVEEHSVPSSAIVTGSYREAIKNGAADIGKDNWSFPKEDMEIYEKHWEEGKKIGGKEGAMMQNEVLQDIASRMGVPVKIYRTLDDLPDYLRNSKAVKDGAGAFHTGDNSIGIILSKCESLTAGNAASLIRHEAVGHMGLPRVFETTDEYNNYLDRLGRELVDIESRAAAAETGNVYAPYNPGNRYKIEERHARMAEKREYIKPKSKSESDTKSDAKSDAKSEFKSKLKSKLKKPDRKEVLLREMDEKLRMSEANIRNTTVGEIRSGYVNDDGNPLPTIWELEQSQLGKLMESLRKEYRKP